MNTFDKFCAGILGAMTGYMAYGFVRYYVLGRREKTNGVGKIKRRVFAEVAEAQKYIDLGGDPKLLSADEKKILRDLANRFGYKGSSKSSKSLEEQYFRGLKRAYQSVSGIGATNLPCEKYVVRNDRGDVVLQYNDYGTEQDIYRDAVNEYEDASYGKPFMATVLYIARGGKFLWSNKVTKRKAGLTWTDKVKNSPGVKESCFATRGDAKEEKKLRRSYLSKDGLVPELVAHQIWEMWNHEFDSQFILDGVCDAIREVESVDDAQKLIVDYYFESHEIRDDYEPDPNLPF